MSGPRKLDPERVYHLQVKLGKTAVVDRLAYGDRATIQVYGDQVTPELLDVTEVVRPDQVPDVAER